MTPKEKAKDLFDRFAVQEYTSISGFGINKDETKELAIAISDEVISTLNQIADGLSKKWSITWWENVKEEINKL